VAHVVDPSNFETDYLGFENHLNVIHAGKEGLPRDLAFGLALFLNSTILDQHFRSFSGHTQVNATDLRTMKFPNLALLRKFGRWAQKQSLLDQHQIDSFVAEHSATV
jgi:adenine-specific DNA-methyltransferase